MNPVYIGILIFILALTAFALSWIYLVIEAENGSAIIIIKLYFFRKKFTFPGEEKEKPDNKKNKKRKQKRKTRQDSDAESENRAQDAENDASGSAQEPEEKNNKDTVLDILKVLYGMRKRFRNGVVIDEIFAKITVATEDAAKTAILYGQIMSAAGAVTGALMNISDMNKVSIGVYPDFDKNKLEYIIKATLKGKIYKLIAILVLFGYNNYKQKKKAV